MLAIKHGFKFSFRAFSREILKNPIEIRIPVPWGEVRGKWWGPTDLRPILTLHGWQDNCGSFDRLIPLLNPSNSFLTIDLPGHGLSSRLPLGIYYHFTTYILTLKYILRFFQWDKVTLMGHSMGGIICYSYTMLYPEKVDFLVCIDGVKPLIYKNRIKFMSKFIDRILKHNEYAGNHGEPPCYTVEEIEKKVHLSNGASVDLQFAKYLMERNIAPCRENEGKFYFTRDPRLKSDEILSFDQTELVEQAHNVTCPIFIVKSKKGSYYEVKENFYEVLDVLKRSSKDCSFHYVEGTHHAHLNNPDEIAEHLRKFIQRNDVENRSGNGLKDEIIVREEDDASV